MVSAHKKVIVRRFVGDVLHGYLSTAQIVRHRSSGDPGAVDLLDLDGRILSLPLDEIKYISYVRDFNLHDTANPERLIRRSFLARPRSAGLWLRLTFRSGDQMEGLAATDLSLLDDLLEDAGLHLTPPDSRSNTVRLYVPRSAITHLDLIAVVTSPSRRRAVSTADPQPSLQTDLFQTPIPPNSRPN